MQKCRGLFFIFVLAVTQLTVAGPELSSQHAPKKAQKNRIEIFKRTLAYLPSFLFSVMGRIPMSRDETYLFNEIGNIVSRNLNRSNSQELILPDKYSLFVVKESEDQRYFDDLEPGLAKRIASTKPFIHEPIMINTLIANDPQVEITLPHAVQILIHEIAWKVPGVNIQLADRFAAKIKRSLESDYQVIELSPTEKLHILNSPIQYQPPLLEMDSASDNFKNSINIFKSHQIRQGREILIFHENNFGFTYVPTLKEALINGIHGMKDVNKDSTTVFSSSVNIEQIRVDRALGQAPLVRFLISVYERAYRYVDTTDREDQSGERKKTGEKSIHSFVALKRQGMDVSEGDEILKTRVEIASRFEPGESVHISRREVLDQEPLIKVHDLIWSEKGASRNGSFRVEIPQDRVSSLVTHDLRAFLWARMEHGLVRIEVQKLIPDSRGIKVEFSIPSSLGTTQAFAIEEVILKNKNHEFVLDLPETIIVRHPQLSPDTFQMRKLERGTPTGWLEVPVEAKAESDETMSSYLNKLGDIPGLIKIKSGKQKMRLIFQSRAFLHEVYFYKRALYLTHDPMARAAMQALEDNPIMKMFANYLGTTNRSASHFQMKDEVIHLPASELKQYQHGSDLIVEFELPMDIMPDKGANTFDTGLRYFGKMIAINQRLEKWRASSLRHPLFSVEGTSYGAKSCRDHFN